MGSSVLKTRRFGITLWICLSMSEGFAEIQIPGVADWTDRGTIIEAGSGWDKRLEGAISPSTVIKKNGTYFLYYIGADGDRSTDGGPRHRALGVATSTDGINFTKYAGNPIITHLPHDNQEEGVFSAAATLEVNNDVVLYYGALWASNSTTESVDIYVTLATSQYGFSFDNRGDRHEYVFETSGEEVDPNGVMRNADTWHIYYINNSSWSLNLLSGPSMDNLSMAGSVSGYSGSAYGGGHSIFFNDTQFVSFVDHYESADPLVLTGSFNNPTNLTQIDRYDGWGGNSFELSTTYLDREART